MSFRRKPIGVLKSGKGTHGGPGAWGSPSGFLEMLRLSPQLVSLTKRISAWCEGPLSGWCGACQGHQRCWSTGAPGPLSYWHTVQSHHVYTVWVASSELLSSQKERQWSHSACPTRAGDIFGNLSLSHPFSCKISPGSRTPFCTYPKASFRQRMQTQGLGPLPLWGRSMTSTVGLWYIPHPIQPCHQSSLALNTKDKNVPA